MTVYAITDTKKGRTGIAPTYLQTTLTFDCVVVCPLPYGRGAISVAFVRPSVCPAVAYIANNSRTKRLSVPKFGMKVPNLRCDSHTSFKIKRTKVRVRGGRGHIVSAEPGGHTACYHLCCG